MYSCKLIGGTVGAYDTCCSLFCFVVAFVQPQNAVPPSPPHDVDKMVSQPSGPKTLCTLFCHSAGSCMPVPYEHVPGSLNRHGAFLGDPHKRR